MLLQPSEQPSKLQNRLMWKQSLYTCEQPCELQNRLMLLILELIISLTRKLLELREHDCDRGAAEPLLLQLKLPVESQSLRLPQLPV